MTNLFHSEYSLKFLRLSLLVGAYILLYILARGLEKYTTKRYSPQIGMLSRKAVAYGGFAVLISMGMHELGFNLSTLLGAAGIVGIAIGFAAQTSLSNLISGIFLIGEKHFQIGDVINIDSKTGVVQSIDLLSIKIKTFDNHLIRIPNENLIKSQLSNITKFPIRRMDINLCVAYHTDLKKLFPLVREVAAKNQFSLEDPEPLIIIKEFGSNSIELLVGLWFVKTDFLNLKNSFLIELKEALDKAAIEIPFPQRVVRIVNS